MKKKMSFLLVLCFYFPNLLIAQPELNPAEFSTLPPACGVHTWWHWVDKKITREGITKDLESMKQQGIVQATILNVGGGSEIDLPIPSVTFNSPEWHSMFKWALQEAKRIGIQIGVHNCDGWSTSGGPWITPELSMKKYVWSKTMVEGVQNINIRLPQPPALENYYRDVAVLAFPAPGKLNSFAAAQPNIVNNQTFTGTVLFDGNPKSVVHLKKGQIIDIAFNKDFTASKIVVFPYLPFTWDDMSKISNQFVLSASSDGEHFSKIDDLEFSGVNKNITVFFPETKALSFRLVYKSSNSLYTETYPIAELEILKSDERSSYAPGITSLLEKTVSVYDINQHIFDKSENTNKHAIAQNSIIDLSDNLSSDGTLKWSAPTGTWQILRFGYTSTGMRNGPATAEGTGLEVDKMDTLALNAHFAGFAEKCIATAGDMTGNIFKFLLIDSWECQYQNWTKNFPQEFVKRQGYDLKTWIPVLCGETVESTQLSEAFLYDFRKTIADLIDINYYKHFSELCHSNNLEMHAEIIYANSGMYPPIDPLQANKYADLVMTEFWATPNENQFPEYEPTTGPTPGFPVYSALANNKQIIGSEAFTGYAHYSESPADLKPFGDLAFCSGVNQIILHSYVHQPADKKPGITLFKFAAHFNRNNPWWDYSQDWMTYQSRIQNVLQKGEPVVDVIFYTGDRLPQYYTNSVIYDLPFGYRANACNFEMLKNQSKVVDGKLSFGGKQSFALLTLPDKTEMNYETLKRVAELVKEGLVVWGSKPTGMLSLYDLQNKTKEFNRLADELWGISNENQYGKGRVISGKSIGDVLNELNVVPDFESQPANPKELLFMHKKMDNADIYFVFNQQKKTLNRDLLFRVEGKSPEIWNPENGTITKPAIFSLENQQVRIPVSFQPNESLIFLFRDKVDDNFIRQVEYEGKQIFPQLPNGREYPIPQVTWLNGKYYFTTQVSGKYSFATVAGSPMNVILDKPGIFEIDHYNAHLEFFPISDESIEPVDVALLKSLTCFDDPVIKYFAGTIKYTILFDSPSGFDNKRGAALYLGQLDATAKVVLNGKLMAYIWKAGTEIPVSGLHKTGNKLEITAATVCRNRLIGDLIQYGEVHSVFTTAPLTQILHKDMPLKPSGLIGPLKLVQAKK